MTMSNGPILGLGTDIIEISRILDSIAEFEDHFLDKLFTKSERSYCDKHKDPAVRYAGRFAAKEAIAKALGTGFGKELRFKDLEILNNAAGKPEVKLSESFAKAHPDLDILITISHCVSYATATAIVQRVSS